MSPKVEYSDLSSEDSSHTLSLDGESESFEKTAFLEDELERSLHRRSWGNLVALVLPWLLVTGLSIALLRTYLSPKRVCAEDGLEKYSPAAEAIEYHDVVFKRDFGPSPIFFSEYAGWPSDEIDQRWDELYYRGFTAIDAESHDRLLNKSVHTPVEGFQDTYMVTLDVFHELHCLNMIRKYFYPRRYNMTLFEDDGETVSYAKWIHLDHCIDTVRQSLMCNADVAVQGYDWFEDLHYIRVRIDTVHRCRNFDRIRDWAWERSVPWNSHMTHVDEETGRVIDYGVVPDPQFVHKFTPEGFHYTQDDM